MRPEEDVTRLSSLFLSEGSLPRLTRNPPSRRTTLSCVVAVAVALPLLMRCSRDSFPAVERETLTQLHEKYIHPTTKAPTSDAVDVYIDYSSGMYEGIKASEKFMGDLLRMVNSPSTRYYKVGAGNSVQVDIAQAAYIPWNLSNYADQMSVLDEPIGKIIQTKDRISIFVTDFELVKEKGKLLEISQGGQIFKSQIDISPWATNQFETWLLEGNRIDIFAKKFSRENLWVTPKAIQAQYVYTLVFTPRGLLASRNDKSIHSRLLELTQANVPDDAYHFSFAADDLKLTWQGYSTESGGLSEVISTAQYFKDEQRNFEYYELSKAELMDFMQQEDQSDKRILKGLTLVNNMDVFPDPQLKPRVFDITPTWKDFSGFVSQATETPEVDAETGEKKPTGKVAAFAYAKPSEDVPEVFGLVFNKETKQIGVKVLDGFTSVNNDTLFQIDVTIESANLSLAPDIDKVLQWRDSRGFTVTSLGSSVREAMTRVSKKMGGKVIYTYYILVTK